MLATGRRSARSDVLTRRLPIRFFFLSSLGGDCRINQTVKNLDFYFSLMDPSDCCFWRNSRCESARTKNFFFGKGEKIFSSGGGERKEKVVQRAAWGCSSPRIKTKQKLIWTRLVFKVELNRVIMILDKVAWLLKGFMSTFITVPLGVLVLLHYQSAEIAKHFSYFRQRLLRIKRKKTL